MPLNVRLQWPLKLRILADEPPVEIELRRNCQLQFRPRVFGAWLFLERKTEQIDLCSSNNILDSVLVQARAMLVRYLAFL